MLTLWGTRHRFCDRVNRREFLRIGALGLGGLSLPRLLQLQAQGAIAERARNKSIIYLCLAGGPSHIDMYDLKPEAPDEYRGEFKPIATNLPGLHICEHMPQQARIFDKMTLVRGVRSVENDHFLSEVYSGLPRSAGARPAFGSVVSRLNDGDGALIPRYVCLDRESVEPFEFQKPYYAGTAHKPFRPYGDALNNLGLAKDMTLSRLDDRRQLLASFDTLRRDLDEKGDLAGMDKFNAQALAMIASSKVRDAFDLSKEPDRVRQRYGKGKWMYNKYPDYVWDNSPLLLARRLVEAGVRVVTLSMGTWDHHGGDAGGSIFGSLRTMLPNLDHGIHALVTDLYERGLDQDVLLVVLGEFGRSPRIAPAGPGRDHWAEAGCALFAGGGLRMGQVIGATDARAERARSGRVGFQNILTTIYQVLGIDPATAIPDFTGRPMYLLDDREAIADLVG